MKKFLKIMMITMLLLNLTFLFTNHVSVAINFKSTISSIGGNGVKGNVDTSTRKIMGALFSIIQVVGTGIALIMLAWVGIKYMTGAPEDKAEFKKSATAYIVGAVILFATVNLVKIIENFAVSNI